MTFEEYWNDAGWHTDFEDDLHEVWAAAQAAERERIKSRVKEAAESIWAVRDLVDNRYGLYIGPPLNTLEEFVNRLLEET